MRHRGKLTNWNDARGFGYISGEAGGAPIFVHASAFPPRSRPTGDEIVTYQVQIDARGRRRAGNVVFAGSRRMTAGSGRLSFSSWFTAGFLLLLSVSTWAGALSPALPAWYLGASATTFAAYWKDKTAARNQRRRTPESRLQLLALIGGWPGAVLAQRLLHHKTGKQSFQYRFRAAIACNCGALLVATPAAARLLRSILA